MALADLRRLAACNPCNPPSARVGYTLDGENSQEDQSHSMAVTHVTHVALKMDKGCVRAEVIALSLAPASPEQAEAERQDHAAVIAADAVPPLPAATHGRQVAAMRSAALQRPPSWFADAPHRPTAGAWCSCCRGQRWWSDDGRGWCCMTCHPPPPALPGQGARIMEVRTL